MQHFSEKETIFVVILAKNKYNCLYVLNLLLLDKKYKMSFDSKFGAKLKDLSTYVCSYSMCTKKSHILIILTINSIRDLGRCNYDLNVIFKIR